MVLLNKITKRTKIAFADKRAAFFALCLFAFILSLPKNAELIFLGLVAGIGIIYSTMGKIAYLKARAKPIAVLIFCTGFVFLIQHYYIDEYAAIAELKFLTIFFVEVLIFHYYLNTKESFHADRTYLFTKYFIITIFFSTLVGTVLGSPRDPLIFGFSINAAYAILLLCAYQLETLPLKLLIVALLAIGLLGSTTAVFLTMILISLRYRKYWILAGIFGLISIVAFYYYSLEFRGKDFLNTDIAEFDRYQITMYISGIIAKNFHYINYIFGWGIGRALPYTDPGNYGVISGWFLPEFTADGIYSSSTHNEYLRMFLDYGAIGIVVISIYFYRLLPHRVAFFLAIAAITNTVLFSTSDIFIIALIMADHRARIIQTHINYFKS